MKLFLLTLMEWANDKLADAFYDLAHWADGISEAAERRADRYASRAYTEATGVQPNTRKEERCRQGISKTAR